MNTILSEIHRTGLVGNEGNKRAVGAEISPEVGTFLSDLIKSNSPSVSLEVGLAYGISSLYICDALTNAGASKHYIIDPNQTAEWGGIGLSNLHAAGFGGLVELREEMSHTALPRLLSEGVTVDFAFIDGWHVFDQVMVDFFFIDKLLRPGGIIAFDDANWSSVRKVLRFIVKNRNYAIEGCSPAPESKRDMVAKKLQPVSRILSKLAMSEFIEPDGALGLKVGSRCVALRKLGDDTRKITHFSKF